MIFDGVEDLRKGMSKFFFEKDEAKKVGSNITRLPLTSEIENVDMR